jgi:sulfate adenylyltransferase subunit 1 (EFTu-like GTPase family)
MNTLTFHVTGTHCASCKILIEDVLNDQSFIKKSNVDLKKETVTIETDGLRSEREQGITIDVSFSFTFRNFFDLL